MMKNCKTFENIILKNRFIKNRKNEQGITIIALAITVLILSVLAGVSIIGALGEDDVIDLSQEGVDQINSEINATISGIEGINKDIEEDLKNKLIEKGPSGKTLITSIKKDDKQNQQAEDKYGNPITIPAGFTVVPNSGTKPSNKTDAEWNAEKVTYTYNGDGTPSVQDGIVIEDGDGNQFVWIPCGTIKNKMDDPRGKTTEIVLGRYEFSTSDGTPDLKQAAYTEEREDNYTEIISVGDYNFQEIQNSTAITTANSLSEFVTKTKNAGGYYLARYEATQGSNNKPRSHGNEPILASINQATAATYAREMYKDNPNFDSDLINSYSWDTAIVFIEKYSKGNSNYANKTSVNTSGKLNSGMAGDVVLNIHDMASNCLEWSTEYCSEPQNGVHLPAVYRGGFHVGRSEMDVLDLVMEQGLFMIVFHYVL